MSTDRRRLIIDDMDAFAELSIKQTSVYIEQNFPPLNVLLFDELKNYLSDFDNRVKFYKKAACLALKAYYKDLFESDPTMTPELLIESKTIESIDDDAFFKEFAVIYVHQLISIYIFVKETMKVKSLSANQVNLKSFFQTTYPLL